MPVNFWSTKQPLGPSAGLVQQHYVQSRLEQLYRRDKGLEKKLAQIITGHPKLAHLELTGKDWLKAYEKITENLMKADLTINFKAESWFATENKYDSYTQMYERAVVPGRKLFLKDTDVNEAGERAYADDVVTFPQRKTGAPAPVHRGLMPGTQSMDRIERQMRFGQQTKVTVTHANGTVEKGVESRNPYFNPKTKQVFAALNYGRRPHGSTVFYGRSFLVLNPKFKVNAIYFPADTFCVKDQYQEASASVQVGHYMLGAVLAYADGAMRSQIIESCYFGRALSDTGDARLLLEGHIFSALPFTGNVESINLNVSPDSVYAANARKWATRHKAKLVFI